MDSHDLIQVAARNWWVWLIRGIVAIVFGVMAVLWPLGAILAFGILFGAYALVDGVMAIIATIRAIETHQRWWPLLFEGLAGMAIAAITFWDVGATLFAVYLVIAAWALVTGVLEIIAAIQLRKRIANEIWLIAGGIASIIFGALLLWRPLAGALALTWIVGIYAVFFGCVMIGFSFRLRGHAAASATVT
jgi:uncharacterized membrane protein HdeD (DUF308 family)